MRRPQHRADRHQRDAGEGDGAEGFAQQGDGGDGGDARHHGQHEGGALRSDVVDGVGEEQAGEGGGEDALIHALPQDEGHGNAGDGLGQEQQIHRQVARHGNHGDADGGVERRHMPLPEQQAERGIAERGQQEEHIAHPLIGGRAGKLAEAVEADQHDADACDQQGEFGAHAGAVPEDEPGDQGTGEGDAAIDQNARVGGGRARKARVHEQAVAHAAERGERGQPPPFEAAPSDQHEGQAHDAREAETDGRHVVGRERADAAEAGGDVEPGPDHDDRRRRGKACGQAATVVRKGVALICHAL